MKKIFAIALALVMVLSMASAFAFCAGEYDWACYTDVCKYGKLKVEIVPFVRSNDACATLSNFVQSDCAAAVVNERVYYGIKLTVDEDVNEDWYAYLINKGSVKVEFTNVSASQGGTEAADATLTLPAFSTVEDGGVFWYAGAGVWDKDKDFDAAKHVAEKYVIKTAAKICAVVKAKNEFVSAVIGDYTVSKVNDKEYKFEADGKTAWVHLDSDYKVEYVDLSDAHTAHIYTYNAAKTGFQRGNDVLKFTCDAWGEFLKGIFDYFKIDFGTCMTPDAVNANFGWDFEQKVCLEWSDKGASVVNPECVVAIPKTGDASVLAWLF